MKEISFGGGSEVDNAERIQEQQSVILSNDHMGMAPAVDWLSYEPNFLYKEFAADQENRIRA